MKSSLLLLIVCALAVFTIIPTASAKISDDQIKSAGAIELTTDLVDKMETAAKAVREDEAARNEVAAVKETDADAWAAAVNSKCPKAAAHLQEAGITAEDLMKGASAILACMMDESGELAKSDNETAKANAEFVNEHKEHCNTAGGAVMVMGMGAEPSDSAKSKN